MTERKRKRGIWKRGREGGVNILKFMMNSPVPESHT